MTNKQVAVFAVFFAFCWGGLAYSAPRGKKYVQRVYQQEGDIGPGISVSCSSETWTAVGTIVDRTRSLFVQSLNSNSYTVCLSTSNTSALTCVDATEGVELEIGMNITFYDTIQRYCRSRTGSSNERIKGVHSYDSEDLTTEP